MARTNATQLKAGDRINEVFFCKRKNLAVDRNGRPYLSAVLSDRSGSVDALLWERADVQAEGFDSADLVRVAGKVVSYQGRTQLHLTEIIRVDAADRERVDLSELMGQPDQQPEELLQGLQTLLATVTNPHLQGLSQALLDDERLMTRLARAPAGRSIHHAYPGGLLEHTLSVMRLTDAICGHYSEAAPGMLDRDLCLLGALLHDLGKTEELSVDGGIHYTDQGRLLGHLTLGMQILDRKLDSLPLFPGRLATQLKHLLLSHHGKLEHGSPRRPKTAEAFVVYRADEMDSALASLREILAGAGPDGWSTHHGQFGRYLFKGWPEEE